MAPRDRADEARTDRLRFLGEARTVAAMDLWIRNAGRPAPPGRERGGPASTGPAARRAIEAEIDRLVGFTADGRPIGVPEAAGGLERGRRVPEHHQASTLREWTFYPEHDPRGRSAEYERTRKRLVVTLDGPCLVCDVRRSTLGETTRNPFGARQMETHHRMIEWALTEAVDIKRFNAKVVRRRRELDPSDATYDHDFSRDEMVAWIDHHEDNLWVLCDVHHRAPYMGIHAITRPHWDPQDLVFPKFWNRPPPKPSPPG